MSGNKYVTTCGACRKKTLESARFQHVYVNTHVHVWPDGHKTMESGTRCANDSLVLVSA